MKTFVETHVSSYAVYGYSPLPYGNQLRRGHFPDWLTVKSVYWHTTRLALELRLRDGGAGATSDLLHCLESIGRCDGGSVSRAGSPM